MKKLLLPILFIMLLLPAMSQSLVSISGTVTDTATGLPIANQYVTISNDSSGGWIYYQTVYTNNSGQFIDTVPVPAPPLGILYVRTSDCQNYLHQVVVNFSPSNLSFTVNFAICNYNAPCVANFTYSQFASKSIQFMDLSQSQGIPITWSWDFGDGGTSGIQNPQHIYGAGGWYSVALSISNQSGCSASVVKNVFVSDSTGGGCQAAFSAFPDSINTFPNTYHFVDQSSGNIISWLWNFGDPASGSNNVSTLQNPFHIYTQPGVYSTCLTIHGADSTCFDMTCNTIVVANGGGCIAEFTYSTEPVTPGTIQFTDLSFSVSGQITNWVWQFGDGQSQTVTFPSNPNVAHTYLAAGTYNACLIIHGSDSSCYDMVCHPINIGFNTGCHANFVHSIPTSTSFPIQFSDMSQVNGGGPITSWHWDFGDPASGTNGTSMLQNPTHLFTAAGAYNVCLTIHGVDSTCFDMTCQMIFVTSDTTGCQAHFSYSPDPALGDHTVAFTDLSTGLPTGWFWSFGDGTSSNVQNPVHTFAGSAITYNVCLTITGNNCTSTYCNAVIVQDSTSSPQIYGNVFAGNVPVSMGMVMIISFDTNAIYQPFTEVSLIDSTGGFFFNAVPNGSYYILAIPMNSNGYLPTYYGNTIQWEQATVITLGTPSNPYNINLVPSDQMTSGPGSASGQINMAGLKSSMLDKINMILMNDQHQPIGYAKVSVTGVFEFPSLAYGTYYLHPEMPGITSDYITVILTPAKPHADVIMTFTGSKILGIRDEVTTVNRWSLYPNPAVDNFTVSIDMTKRTIALVDIYNQTGQIMSSFRTTLNEGANNFTVSTAALPSGIYSLHIMSGEGVILTTKIVITK